MATVFVLTVKVAHRHVGLFTLSRGIEAVKTFGTHPIIWVWEDRVFSCSLAQAIIAGIAQTTILLMINANASVFARIFLTDAPRTILGAIIDEQQLIIGEGLGSQGVDAAAHQMLHVENRNYDRYCRHIQN